MLAIARPNNAGEVMAVNRVPFEARLLTKQELDREDIYITRSPKCGRAIMIVGVFRFAFWIEQEFNPAVERCIERPRDLDLCDGRSVEIDFWTRSKSGEEVFWVLIGANELSILKEGDKPQSIMLWNQAAQKAGLSLQFAYEHKLQLRSQHIANFLRLLPHVQAGRRLSNKNVIYDRVKELFSLGVISLSFIQIETSLQDFSASDVRIAVCTLIHTGWLSFPIDLPISNATRLTREHL